MIRFAVPVTQGRIPNHLGHCDSFLIAEVEGTAIVREELLANPGHGPGGPPPVFVARQGVQEVLAWGIPPHAQEMFAKMGIRVRLGATGEARQALLDHLAGTLKTTTEALDAGGSCEAPPREA